MTAPTRISKLPNETLFTVFDYCRECYCCIRLVNKRWNIVVSAVKPGHLQYVYYFNLYGWDIKTNNNDNDEIVANRITHMYNRVPDIAKYLVKYGHLDLLQKIQIEPDYHYISMAAQYGHLNILKYLHAIFKINKPRTLVIAAVNRGAIAGGHLDLLKWCEQTYEWHYSEANLSMAIDKKFNDITEHICKQIKLTEVSSYTMVNAISASNIKMVKYLHGHEYKFTEQDLIAAAAQTDVAILKYVMGNMINPNIHAAYLSATKAGSLANFKLLHNDSTFNYTAMSTCNLNFIKYICEKFGKWPAEYDKEYIHNIVSKGYLDTLKYAIQIGCKLDADAIITAIKHREYDIMVYLFDNNCPVPDATIIGTYAISNAAMDSSSNVNQKKILLYLIGVNQIKNVLCQCAIDMHQFFVLKFLRKNNCPWDINSCKTISNVLISICNNHFYSASDKTNCENISRWMTDYNCPCGRTAHSV